jgi:tetratricopeptide (TPR) repeat protein
LALSRAVALALKLALASAPGAGAMQGDPRLDPLFAQLEAAPDLVTARGLEAQIWAIWGEGPDDGASAELAAGGEEMARRAWPRALGRLDALILAHPDFAEAWNRRATLYYLMGEYERSVADIERTLMLEPRHFGALSGLGLIFMAVGKAEAAIRSFEAALAIHPFLPGARQNVEMLRQQLRGEPL